MSDLVQRLRDSVRACRALDRSALLREAADEIERLRMTEAERHAVEVVIGWMGPHGSETLDTLRGLVDRLG